MSFTITEAMVAQYNANVRMLAEQTKSALRVTCEDKEVVGKTFYGDNLKGSEWVTKTGRHSDSPFTPVTHGRRKGTIIDKHWGDFIDQQDKEKVLTDFNGKYVVLAVAGGNRCQDDVIIEALGGAAYSGETGGTTVNNYDSGECRLIAGDGTLVTAGSNFSDTTATALTVAKLALCGQILDQAGFTEENGLGLQRYFVTNAYNKWQLLQATEVKSSDYNTVKALAEGKIDTFMGFKFKWSERLATDGTETDCINSYAFVQGAIAFGVGQEIRTEIWKRSDKSGADYVYGSQSIGATRQEGPAVIEINLKKAA